jgi:hypothetical protein
VFEQRLVLLPRPSAGVQNFVPSSDLSLHQLMKVRAESVGEELREFKEFKELREFRRDGRKPTARLKTGAEKLNS